MSPKARPPRLTPAGSPPDGAPELAPEQATALAAAGITIYPLTGELGTTLEAIRSAAALLDQAFAGSGVEDSPPDLLAEVDEDVVPVALAMRVLARSLIASALGRPPVQPRPHITPPPRQLPGLVGSIGRPGETGGGEAIRGLGAALGPHSSIDPHALDELARALLPKNLPRVVRPSAGQRELALFDAERLLREVGLEEFDVSCHVVLARDETPTLAVATVHPETAHVWLIESLFERAEVAAISGEPLLAAERDASAWEFSCWSADSSGSSDDDHGAFARTVREQEYSLVDRVTLALDASVLGDLAGGDELLELFPRQHRVAQALLGSFTGVFECTALEGNRATFRSLTDDRTYAVHEHMMPAAYAPGAIGFGRLLPFDGALHLRSPGMTIVPGPAPELADAAARTLSEIGDLIPPALAMEGLISTFVYGAAAPREVKPAASRSEARALRALIEEMLEEIGLEREISDDDAPPDLRARAEGMPEVRYVEFGLDATMSAYLTALADQATARGSRGAKARKGKRRR